MQKAVVDCATGRTVIVDMPPEEEAALQAFHDIAGIPPPQLTLDQKLARVGVSVEELRTALAATPASAPAAQPPSASAR